LDTGSPQFSEVAPLTPEMASHLAEEAVEVVVARLDVEPDAVNALAGWLNGDERQRARRFQFEPDRQRFIVARGRLRQLLATRLDIEPQSVELSYAAHGKPVLARGSATQDWRFNVSHSGDVAVFAFCRGREVGIDVEAVHSVSCSDAVAGHFFSRNELEAYLALDAQDKELGFFHCWTRKEAFIKAVGDGLRYPLDVFDVSVSPREPARILRVGNMDGNDCGWCLRSFIPTPGYVAAIVIERSRAATNDAAFLNGPACRLWTR
jgi:4'-phosphopantetheinyl transferase